MVKKCTLATEAIRKQGGICCFSLWIEWSGIRLVPAYRFILEVLETWNSKLRILTDFLGTHTNYLNAGSISVARTTSTTHTNYVQSTVQIPLPAPGIRVKFPSTVK
jgi:hypothetical protein